jgi:hypothetical protein
MAVGEMECVEIEAKVVCFRKQQREEHERIEAGGLSLTLVVGINDKCAKMGLVLTR